MPFSEVIAEKILKYVRLWHPDWNGFDTPKFVQDELEDKWQASEKARDLLSQAEFERLLEKDDVAEALRRLKKIGHTTNLLYLSTPQTSDLRLLYDDSLDKRAFVEQVYDLLYGPGISPGRLQRFVDFLAANNVKAYWTFPTYFLFLIHPQTDIFIKPQTFYDFFALIGRKKDWSRDVSGEAYRVMLNVAHDLTEALAAYHPRDMIDIQSLIWVAARAGNEVLVVPKKREEFQTMFAECVDDYLDGAVGEWHLGAYAEARAQAQANFQHIMAKAERGEDITDDVLLRLLPYADSASNRAKGAWIHPAPAINGDIRKWFESQGWARAEDWPEIAQAILRFVRRSVEHPEELRATVQTFADSPYSKGLQSGALSPILNALRPDDFAIVNTKPLRALEYFAGKRLTSQLREYPEANEMIRRMVSELTPIMEQHFALEGLRPGDAFDAFCHWLVAIKKFDFRTIQYWKIAPGEQASHWPECLEGGYIAIGWKELGDLSQINWREFNQRRDELARQFGWTKTSMKQAWDFAKKIKEGDIVIANRGTEEALGIGAVTGPYYFVPDAEFAHRFPVAWEDTRPRKVNQPGWRHTLVKLSREDFLEILQAPDAEHPLVPLFSQIFISWEEAESGFDFLRRTLALLDVGSPNDARLVIAFPKKHGGRVLRLIYGNWLVVDLRGPEAYHGHGVTLALCDELMEAGPWAEKFPKSTTFDVKTGEPTFSLYHLPWLLPAGMDEDLRSVYEQSMREIGQRFAHWKASNYQKYHLPEVLEAILDSEKREELFVRGLTPKPLPEDEEMSAFTTRTFELLKGLHEDPIKDYYSAHKAEIQRYVIEPFQALMRRVAALLPPAITEIMETERRIFSRILKNDYGRGGAYDYYWGAFYPKDSKRTNDAQLIAWITRELLGYGFRIADSAADKKETFVKNVQAHPEVIGILKERIPDLAHYLTGHLSAGELEWAKTSKPGDWETFFDAPDLFQFDLTRVRSEQELLSMSLETLAKDIDQVYEDLFPLVLLAIEDDPMLAIARYLGEDAPPVENAAFTQRAFELLADLREQPTKIFYNEHRDEFQNQVIEPFKQIMRAVAEKLPPAITDVLETEKGVFSRIPKNDYGKGGAWDFFWGAFFPKGDKRIESAQLSMWMNFQFLEYGFYIGLYGSERRDRFARNLRQHPELFAILREHVRDWDRFVTGSWNVHFRVSETGDVEVLQPASFDAFLENPAAFDFDLSVILPKQKVLALSFEELVDGIAKTYEELFPFVLLAIEDDPMPVIVRYLGMDEEEEEIHPEYPLFQMAEETGFDEGVLERWVRAIHRKGQAILYGPPGTGKTYVAEHLARHLVGGGNGVIQLVQFHPAYAYEDFIQGIRPESDGERLTYPMKPGRFLRFIQETQRRQGISVLIIDEINRANLARVFGELMYLLEYRDREIPLAGGGVLRIPENVRIIGTMNTADRSIALVDHALRRRFAFLALWPDYNLLRHYHQRHATDFPIEGLIDVLEKLNRTINDPHYEVGVSFFMRKDLDEQIEDIWRMEIEPYLEEYFFDQPDKVKSFRWEVVGEKIVK